MALAAERAQTQKEGKQQVVVIWSCGSDVQRWLLKERPYGSDILILRIAESGDLVGIDNVDFPTGDRKLGTTPA